MAIVIFQKKVHILDIFFSVQSLFFRVSANSEARQKVTIPTYPPFFMTWNVLVLKEKAHVPIDFIFVLDCWIYIFLLLVVLCRYLWVIYDVPSCRSRVDVVLKSANETWKSLQGWFPVCYFKVWKISNYSFEWLNTVYNLLNFTGL